MTPSLLMRKREPYAAARTIAPSIESYFGSHREAALRRSESAIAPQPEAGDIEAIIDAAFWASLRREEGYAPRISLALVAPDHATDAIIFERPLPLDPAALTRVSPAVEHPGIHLGVWRRGEALAVWGATHSIPFLCLVVEVAAPGLLVVKHDNGRHTRKFINIAVLEGDQVKMVDEHAFDRPDAPQLLRSLLNLNEPAGGAQSLGMLVRLALSMRAHGHGGTALIVPAESDGWRDSTMQPLPYGVSPPFGQCADCDPGAVTRAIEMIGGLTAVDGAAVLNSRFHLLGFGAKIVRLRGSLAVEQVLLSEPIHGVEPALVHPDQIGGTRHLSAAQFVHDQPGCVALVASQDGRFTVFEFSRADGMVHAHRVETLLL